MQHEREQTQRLRLVWHESRHKSTELERFSSQAPPACVGACDAVPAAAVRGVDRVQNRLQARLKLACVRELETDARVADLGFGATEPLTHRRGLDDERRADASGIEAE